MYDLTVCSLAVFIELQQQYLFTNKGNKKIFIFNKTSVHIFKLEIKPCNLQKNGVAAYIELM